MMKRTSDIIIANFLWVAKLGRKGGGVCEEWRGERKKKWGRIVCVVGRDLRVTFIMKSQGQKMKKKIVYYDESLMKKFLGLSN